LTFGLIGEFGGHHHPGHPGEDNSERQQGPQHHILLQADFPPDFKWAAERLPFMRGLRQIDDIAGLHFDEPGVALLQQVELRPAQEADRGQIVHNGKALTHQRAISFN
jgi:hypothetical protein